MSVHMKSHTFRFVLFLIAIGLLSGFLWKLAAYDSYSDVNNQDIATKCAQCHDPGVAPFGDGFKNRGTLHDLHTANATNNCDLCHFSQSGDVPRTYTSAGGVGCIGCHGQGATGGAGLRLHHIRAHVPADSSGLTCGDICHSDSSAPPEDTLPPYYGRSDVDPTDPCNSDGLEDFPSDKGGDADTVGLDNDGDLLVDAADPDCELAPPPEIQNVGYSDPTLPLRLTWDPQVGAQYDVIRSDGPQFPAASALTTCLEIATPLTWSDDLLPTPVGGCFYYLVRNTLAPNYGAMSDGTLREYTVCP